MNQRQDRSYYFTGQKVADVKFKDSVSSRRFVYLMSRCRQQSLSSDDDALTLDKCEEIFNTLQEDYYEEFKVF